MEKLRTSLYRPEMNGQCECFSATLIGMLGTLPPHDKCNWQEWVSILTHAYNCTISSSDHSSPFFLMFGYHPKFPIDVEFDVTQPDIKESLEMIMLIRYELI